MVLLRQCRQAQYLQLSPLIFSGVIEPNRSSRSSIHRWRALSANTYFLDVIRLPMRYILEGIQTNHPGFEYDRIQNFSQKRRHLLFIFAGRLSRP